MYVLRTIVFLTYFNLQISIFSLHSIIYDLFRIYLIMCVPLVYVLTFILSFRSVCISI